MPVAKTPQNVLAFRARRQNEAEAHLDYAFEHCHARAAKNKAAIARFLIPVRMLLGALPAMGLLEAFGLTVYAPFVEVPPCPVPPAFLVSGRVKHKCSRQTGMKGLLAAGGLPGNAPCGILLPCQFVFSPQHQGRGAVLPYCDLQSKGLLTWVGLSMHALFTQVPYTATSSHAASEGSHVS